MILNFQKTLITLSKIPHFETIAQHLKRDLKVATETVGIQNQLTGGKNFEI